MSGPARFAAKRLETVPRTTVWSEFTPLAIKHNAINLGQGFPNYPPEQFVTEAGVAALQDPHPLSQQYCRPLGHMSLVSVLQKRYSALLRREDPGIQTDEVLVMNGTTQALNVAITATVSPGDEVIVIEPFFDLYVNGVVMAGGTVKYIQMKPPANPSRNRANDWTLDWDELRALITPKTKGILFNTPQNVPGKVWSAEEIGTLAKIAIEKDLLVYADEVYDRLVYDGCQHISIASLPGMWERTITMASAGKALNVTGWKIGWAVAPAPIVEAMGKVHAHQAFSVATPLQVAVGDALRTTEGNDYFDRFTASYLKRRDLLCEVLASAGLPPTVPQGSFFVLADISHVDPEAFDYDASPSSDVGMDWQFCRWMTAKIGVTAIPVTAFVSAENRAPFEKYVRFAFCKTEEQIIEAKGRLAKLGTYLKKQ